MGYGQKKTDGEETETKRWTKGKRGREKYEKYMEDERGKIRSKQGERAEKNYYLIILGAV